MQTGATHQRRRVLKLEGREQGFFLLLVSPAVLSIAFFLIYPLWGMLALSFGSADSVAINYSFETFDQYRKALIVDVYRNVFVTTFWISALTTIACLCAGYPVAYVLANTSDRLRLILIPLVIVPFWTSVLVRTFSWRIILGRNGPINGLLDSVGLINEPLDLVFNRIGTLIGMVHILLPLMVLPIYSVMRGIPTEYSQAAESLGAGPFTAWRRVYLPLSLPGVGAGVLLVFILSIGFFITPALLGSPGDRMVSNAIETQIAELNNWEFASALSFILLGGTLLLYFVYVRFVSFESLYGEGRR